MMNTYLEILKEWERTTADPAIYERLDVLFPSFGFRRMLQGSDKDHWASPLKLDGTPPKRKNQEKTVVYRSEMKFREQGEWSEGQSIIDRLVMDRGLSNIYEAYVYADSVLGLGMPRKNSEKVSAALAKAGRRSALLRTLQDYFTSNLFNNRTEKAASTRNYLFRLRRFTQEQARALGLGFVPDWNKVMHHVIVEKGYTIEELEEACGVRNEKGKTAVGRIHVLSIPYMSGGVLKGFLFRRINDNLDGPKYMANHDLDRKSSFFNMPEGLEEKDLVVVEGEFDALKATAEGIRNVVAIGGSEIAGERKRQVEDALRRGVKWIVLCLDLDEDKSRPGTPNLAARHEHLMKSIHTIKDVCPAFDDIYVVQFPYPTDPDQFIRERGEYEFRLLLDKAVPYWQYLYNYMQESRGAQA